MIIKGKPLIAVLDANVLFPQHLRDVLLSVSFAGVFAARWTNQIHDEWTRNLLLQRPDIAPSQLERTRRPMNSQIDESLVEGYEPLIETLSLPDADDRHVLAAAIHASASQIVTWNLADFPASALQPHDIEAISPDRFLVALFADASGPIAGALAAQRARYKRPPHSAMEFLDLLSRQRLTQCVAALRPFEDQL